jgi:hypothetical protein
MKKHVNVRMSCSSSGEMESAEVLQEEREHSVDVQNEMDWTKTMMMGEKEDRPLTLRKS